MTDIRSIVNELMKERKTHDGIKCLRLFKIENYQEIIKEVEEIVSTKPATVIGDIQNKDGHYLDIDEIIPYNEKVKEIVKGAWRTHRILRSNPGWLENESYIDVEERPRNFFYPEEFPNIASFIKMFPYAIGANISGLLPHTQLMPHVDPMGQYWKGKPSISIRFHLPLVSNQDTFFWFNGKVLHLEVGYLYLFNGAAIHSAINQSNKSRYNIIVDCLACNKLNPFFENSLEVPITDEFPLEVNEFNIKKTYLEDINHDPNLVYIWDNPYEGY